MATKRIDFDVVRRLAKALPGVEESTIHGSPSLKVRGRLLACPALHKSADPDTLAVRIGMDQRAELMATEPHIYYVTDHYSDYPTVLVRLTQMRRESLRSLLRAAWLFVTDKSTGSGKKVRSKKKTSASRRTRRRNSPP